jgi:TPR repeat protein
LIVEARIFDHDAPPSPFGTLAGERDYHGGVTGFARLVRIGVAAMRRAGVARFTIGFVACLLIGLCLAPAVAQGSGDERRVALVVGNFNYEHVPRLANPGNDATLIAKTLQSLGFTLVGNDTQENVDKAHFDRLVQDFGRAIQGADVALFYYAGHGMQVDGSNWLVPTDANPTRPQDLEFQMLNADLVLKQMDGAGTRLNLVLLDACRNNPFATLGTRAVQSGLAQMHAPEGTMISFATQPGNVAADGSGADGPYATALAAAMRQPGLDIFRVFNQVGLAVKRTTDGSQLPWVSSSPIDGEFYFVPTEATADAMASAAIEAAPTVPIGQHSEARTASPATGVAAANGASQVPSASQATSEAATGSVSPVNGAVPAAGSVPVAAQTTNAAPAVSASQANVAPATGDAVPANGALMASNAAPASSAEAADPAAAAVDSLQKLAAQGNADAQFDLGFAYAKGQGVARDDEIARHWFELAAAQGVAKAQYWMGAMLERGRGGPRNYADALQWYQRAAAQGFSPAEVAMGRFYGRGLGVARDMPQRTEWYRRAADHDNALAQWVVGNFYRLGDGIKQDSVVARQWYLRSAGHGYVPAELRLGLMAEHGNGVPQDYAEAMRWFRQAADAGNAEAMNDLGALYRNGSGAPKDYAQAMQLFLQAADKGFAMAEYNLGLMYSDGQGVKADKVVAREWFEKAAAAGNQPAIARLAQVDAVAVRTEPARSGVVAGSAPVVRHPPPAPPPDPYYHRRERY